VIESYLPEINLKPIQYATSRIHKLIKFSTPRQLSKTLKKYGIIHERGKYKRNELSSEIDFFKRHIKEGPVIIIIS